MTWARIDDNLPFHPKVVQAGNEAMGLWVRALSWSAGQLTDGKVPAKMLPVFAGTEANASELVEAGLWHETFEGYEFHDWNQYQISRAEVEAKREEARERMRKVRSGGKSKPSAAPSKRPKSSPEPESNEEGTSDAVHDAQSQSHITTSNEVVSASEDAATKPKPKTTKPTAEPKTTTRGSRIAEDWKPDAKLVEYASLKAPALNVEREAERFVNYFLSASGPNAVKRDWRRAFQNWLLSGQERAESSGWKAPVASKATAADDAKLAARVAWLEARGVTLAEYEAKHELPGWLDSLKVI